MDLNKQFNVDTSLEEKGVWIQMDEETKVLIARNGNAKYREVMTRRTAPFKAAIRNNILPEKTAEKILIEAMADAILLGWEGMKENGAEIPYTRDKAVEMLTKYKEFRDFISETASQVELYKQQEDAASAGN